LAVGESRSGTSVYGAADPIPVGVADLSELVEGKPRGLVTSKLKWEKLESEDFERLIFSLVSSESGYENPEWLTRTNAPDRGRDISVYRVVNDPLAGVLRSRVILQCRHWLSKSINVADVKTLEGQMTLWEPPKINVLTITTSGRFSEDAIQYIERKNQSGDPLRIEMWPESHIERLLASRPALIAEFGLR